METILDFLSQFWIRLQQGILPSLGYWNYAILAFFVMIEGFVSILLGAAAASAGILKLPLVILAACCGNLISDTLWYQLGYSGNKEWISRLTKKISHQSPIIDQIKGEMDKHAWKLLLLAKFSGGLAIPALIAIGLARVPMKKWFPVVFLGEMIKTTILAFIGYYTTLAIRQVANDIRYGMLLVTIALIISGIFWARKKIKEKKAYQIYFEIQEKQRN